MGAKILEGWRRWQWHRLKRYWRRLRHVFRWEPLFWEYESCERCGSCYRVSWWARPEAWERIIGKWDGTLCLSCFVEIAERKGFAVFHDDIENVDVFVPEDRLGWERIEELTKGGDER